MFVRKLNFFQLVNNTLPGRVEPGYDPYAKIQPPIDHINRVFKKHYIPHEQFSIDECSGYEKSHTANAVFTQEASPYLWNRAEIQKYGLSHAVIMIFLRMGYYLIKRYHNLMNNRAQF
jgi:hypothetical protein